MLRLMLVAAAGLALLGAVPTDACEQHYLTGFYRGSSAAIQIDGHTRIDLNGSPYSWEVGDMLLVCDGTFINLSKKRDAQLLSLAPR